MKNERAVRWGGKHLVSDRIEASTFVLAQLPVDGVQAAAAGGHQQRVAVVSLHAAPGTNLDMRPPL
jgi:hypothetical protein